MKTISINVLSLNFSVYLCCQKLNIYKMAEEEKEKLTKEEVVAWYKEQIEIATLRADLSEQQARAVQYESARLQHMVMIAQITEAKENILDDEEELDGPTKEQVNS